MSSHQYILDDYNEEKQGSLCCINLLSKDTKDATGAGLIRMGNGPVLMSNVFLATSFLTLAQKEIGCYHDDDDFAGDDCGKVYGFKPSSLVSLIATVSGVLTTLFLPIIGAIIDCTSYRLKVGYIAACITLTIQTIQIGTVQSTWFPMIILQAINGFIYLVQTLAAFSYYPEIARDVGLTKMTSYLADYTVLTFGTQLIYLIVVVSLGFVLDFDDIALGQLGQALCVVVSGPVYVLGWHRYFTLRPAARKLSQEENLAFSGFVQVFKSFTAIWKHYKASLGFFFLAVMLGEAGANAFVNVAVTYLTIVLDFGGTGIGLLFMVVLACTVPGSYIGAFVSKRYTPKISILINIALFIISNFAGFLRLQSPDDKPISFLFAAIWGCLLGWFYPTESLIFSMLMPEGQESELAGFYLYCSQIFSWLPPLVFTMMNEAGISLSWGGVQLNIYFLMAGVFYCLMKPWESCLEASKINLMME